MKFVNTRWCILLILPILSTCQSQDVTTTTVAPEEIEEIATTTKNVNLPSLTVQTSSIRVVDDVNTLQVNGIGSVEEVQIETETTEATAEKAPEVEETTSFETSEIETKEATSSTFPTTSEDEDLTTQGPFVPEVRSVDTDEGVTTVEPQVEVDSTTIENDETTTLESTSQDFWVKIVTDETAESSTEVVIELVEDKEEANGSTETPSKALEIEDYSNDNTENNTPDFWVKVVSNETESSTEAVTELIQDETNDSIEEPSEIVENAGVSISEETEDETDEIPENLRPKFPAAQPRAIGKIVPSVQDFAERVRNGKQLEEESSTITSETVPITTTTTGSVVNPEEAESTEQPEEVEVEVTTFSADAISEESEAVTESSASIEEVIEETTTNPESLIDDSEETDVDFDTSIEVTEMAPSSPDELESTTTLPEELIELVEVTTLKAEVVQEEISELIQESVTDSIELMDEEPIEESEEVSTEVNETSEPIDEQPIEESEEVSTEGNHLSEPIDVEPIVSEVEEPSNPSPIEESLGPRITSQPAMIQFFTVGEPFVLICEAESQTGDEVQYSWTRNGHFLRENDPVNQIYRESLTNGNLLFISPKIRDVGTYQCVAETLAGKSFSQASLLMVQKEAEAIAARLVDNNEVVLVDTREPRQERVFVVMPEDDN